MLAMTCVRIGHRDLTRSRAMSSAQQIGMPEGGARAGIGVESIDAVVLCSHEHYVVLASTNGELRYPERLGIYVAVHRAGKQFPECSAIHARGSESELLGVGSIARKVVAIGENTGKICDGDGGGCALASICGAGGSNDVYPPLEGGV